MEEGAWELCPLYYLLGLSVNLKVILKKKKKKKRPINKKKREGEGSYSQHSQPGLQLSPDQTVNSLEAGSDRCSVKTADLVVKP